MTDRATLDRNWAESRKLLIDAAHAAGIDPAILVKISGFESRFNAHARPVSSHASKNTVRQFDGTMALSSAYGYGQFLDGTWAQMMRMYGEKYGVPHAPTLSDHQANEARYRNDPRLQAAMLAEFTRENIVRGARLGGPDADANVYALHNLGSSDGLKFLSALREHPNQRIDRVLSARVIQGNPALYGDGSRTVAECYRTMGELMDRYEPYARTVEHHSPHAPASPSPGDGTSSAHAPGIRLDDAYAMSVRYDNVRYGLGAKDLSRGSIDCAGWVMEIGNATMREVNRESGRAVFDANDMFHRTTSDQMIAQTARRSGVLLTSPLTPSALKEGMIIGEDNGPHRWEPAGRFHGIDHITMIVRNPSTGELVISQSRGGEGVEIIPLDRYLADKQRRGVRLYATDPLHKARPLLDGHSQAAPGPVRTPAPTHANAALSALADGALTLGEKGAEVRAMQIALDRLGYKDAAGHALAADGIFGPRTLEALQAFQRDHGLTGKGIDGPLTQRALLEASAALVTAPSHPQHALFEQTLRKVEEAERARGIAPGPHSERLAAALTTELVREGITRVDRVEFNRDGSLIRAVQVSPTRDESGLNHATDAISTRQASVQTVAESSRQVHEVAVNVQAQKADPQFTHAPSVRAPAMAH